MIAQDLLWFIMYTPTGVWTYYFCFFCRLSSRLVSGHLKEKYYPIFTKFGMHVYWVNSLHGIAFGEDSCIAE